MERFDLIKVKSGHYFVVTETLDDDDPMFRGLLVVPFDTVRQFMDISGDHFMVTTPEGDGVVFDWTDAPVLKSKIVQKIGQVLTDAEKRQLSGLLWDLGASHGSPDPRFHDAVVRMVHAAVLQDLAETVFADENESRHDLC